MKKLAALSLLFAACAANNAALKNTAPLGGGFSSREVALAGGNADGVYMDFLAFDPKTGIVWVPAGNTGAVYVVDSANGNLSKVEGFPTKEIERKGKKRVVGPSSVTVGDGVVYVGNRGDSSVCAIDQTKLTRGARGMLDSMPDGIVWVAATKEVWVTTPRDKSIRILDGATLAEKGKLPFEGEPEGYAVDGAHGLFYTNLEDKDVTLAIDINTHEIKSTWKSGCGEDGPHGLALDETGSFLMVACSTRVEVLDAAHGGTVLSSIDTGDGVDLLDYVTATRTLYVAAAKAARLTIARLDDKGQLTLAAQVETKPGARNGVVDGKGNVYIAHSPGAGLIVVSPPAAADAASPAKQ